MKANSIFEALKEWILRHPEENREKPYMVSGKNVYTLNDILDDIEKRGEISTNIVKGMIKLSIELLTKEKVKFEDL